jgi:protein-tyrosine phosphatase
LLTIPKYRFAPASLASDYVFGSERPGYPSKVVSSLELNQWLSFMDDQGIERICCLLDEEQLGFYSDSPLLQTYEKKYGSANVLHALVPDFQLCPVDLLVDKILPFLKDSLSNRKKTVVHCSGGKGRTGHVLAAWLVHAENKSPDESIVTVSSLYREPLESIERGNASREDLDRLLVRAGL